MGHWYGIVGEDLTYAPFELMDEGRFPTHNPLLKEIELKM